MRPVFAFLLLALLCFASTRSENDFEEDSNDDFAEFDDEFDGSFYTEQPVFKSAEASAGGGGAAASNEESREKGPQEPRKPAPKATVESDEEEDGLVEDDDEFEHFQVSRGYVG